MGDPMNHGREQARHYAAQNRYGHQADLNRYPGTAGAEHRRDEAGCGGAHGQADAEFAGALGREMEDDAVQTDACRVELQLMLDFDDASQVGEAHLVESHIWIASCPWSDSQLRPEGF